MTRRSPALAPALLVLAAWLASCASERDVGLSLEAAAEPGDWSLPAEVTRIGNTMYVPYDAAGPWRGEAGCAGGLTDGARYLANLLDRRFAGIDRIYGYSCRANTGDTSQMSVHGTGRALDIMIPMVPGGADNGVGDPIAEYLIVRAEEIGLSYIIWDRSDWGAHRSVPKLGDYGGPIPHTDHLHVEITEEAAAMRTPFFADRDGDGVRNDADNCPEVANAGQNDLDGDGVGDRCDDCVRDANASQRDQDGDGVGDRCDVCVSVANPMQVDDDDDGRGDACDNCDAVANAGQRDTDGDERGDACDGDDDDDGVPDEPDNCPLVVNAAQRDTDDDGRGDACTDDDDGDGVLDSLDVCPRAPDPDQSDGDADGEGDACDDRDGDGVLDAQDICAEVADAPQSDLDGDGEGDACDLDRDGDGVPDVGDVCPEALDAGQADRDGDGVGDACDADRDGDGALDDVDLCPDEPDPEQGDLDRDGLGDACDPSPEVPVPDEPPPDDDGPSPRLVPLSGGCRASAPGARGGSLTLVALVLAAFVLRARTRRARVERLGRAASAATLAVALLGCAATSGAREPPSGEARATSGSNANGTGSSSSASVGAPVSPAAPSLAPGFAPSPWVARGVAGGPVEAYTLEGSCIGSMPRTPQHVLEVRAPLPYLAIGAYGNIDLTLAVHLPDGRWLCNDDWDGLNPRVEAPIGRGRLEIYVGTYSSTTQGSRTEYVLGLSELGSFMPSMLPFP